MRTIFDKATREELINRIHSLDEQHTAQWGKMNLFQMLKHYTNWDEWIQGIGQPTYKQEFIGRIFGKIALRRMIGNERPFDKNVPTSKQFKPTEKTGNIEAEKKKWIGLLEQYENYDNPGFIHDFFGKMTREQIGFLVYKHADHHLRQFNS